MAHMAKNLFAMQEMWFQSLGQEDPLARGMVIHSSILAWRIPWTEEADGLQSMRSQRVRHNWVTYTTTTMIKPLPLKKKKKDNWREFTKDVSGAYKEKNEIIGIDITVKSHTSIPS